MGNFLRLVSVVWSLNCRLRSAEKNTRQHRKYCWYCPRFSVPFSLLFGADWTLSTDVALLVSPWFPTFGTALPHKKTARESYQIRTFIRQNWEETWMRFQQNLRNWGIFINSSAVLKTRLGWLQRIRGWVPKGTVLQRNGRFIGKIRICLFVFFRSVFQHALLLRL